MAFDMVLMLLVDLWSIMAHFDCDCWSAFRCCVVCVSRFSLSLTLSNRVLVVVAAAVPVALGGKDVMVMKMLIENMLMLPLMIKDCWVKQTNMS